ncbi:MAG: hypothetical protein F7C08_00115 [Desulfurococcales archaeon]|nr:hypothetical protein [Desulfurococcales archaeon]MCE4604933.1 hypothetical protein [Desulfurococcales archaeon]
MRSIALILVIGVLMSIPLLAGAQIEPPVQLEVKGNTKIVINEVGTASVEEEIKFSASAFNQFRQMYNPLSTFVRDLAPRNMPIQIEELQVNLDEANNKLTATYKILGMAKYMGGDKWVVKLGDPKDITLSTQNDNTFVFTNTFAAGAGIKLMETVTVVLPPGAENPTYQEDEGTIIYYLPLEGQDGEQIKYLGLGLAAAGAAIIVISLVQSRREVYGGSEVGGEVHSQA